MVIFLAGGDGGGGPKQADGGPKQGDKALDGKVVEPGTSFRENVRMEFKKDGAVFIA
jgi:hypothetical protein